MKNDTGPELLLQEYRKLLGMQIKLDIAKAIREHPHLEGGNQKLAYDKLADNATIDALVRELANEEVQDTVSRGHLPPAAMLALAGFKPNPAATC
jgi:hypothetical protein